MHFFSPAVPVGVGLFVGFGVGFGVGSGIGTLARAQIPASTTISAHSIS